MPVYVSMLRGVNIGGHNKIKMEALRALYESLGFQEPQSFIQSGNVVFRAKERNPTLLSKRITDAIEKKFKFRPAVLLRSVVELRRVITANPFADRKGIDPSKLAVSFLEVGLDAGIRAALVAMECAPEELCPHDRELYIYFPNGMARPKLSMPKVERILKTACTARNWNTVQKLLEMAVAMESGK
jgi:uncharacterized protein (DUF1697 family)